MKRTLFFIGIGIVLCVCGCSKTEYIRSSDASVATFTLSHDSMPNLKNISFKILTRESDTGTITNVDSIDYEYDLSKVVMNVSYNYGTSAAAIFYPASVLPSKLDTVNLQDSVVNINGSDTINVSVYPVFLLALSTDNSHLYKYKIHVLQHQIDPYLYVWDQVVKDGELFSADGVDVKAIYLNEEIYLFTQDGFGVQLYNSSDGLQWHKVGTPTGLPTNTLVRNILCATGHRQVYYADEDLLYTSTDALNWTSTNYSSSPFTLKNMLYEFNDSIWAIVQHRVDDAYQLAISDGIKPFTLWGSVLPSNFPLSDFAAVTFTSASNRKRALVMGGYDSEGHSLNTRWSMEYSVQSGYRMTDFTTSQPQFTDLTGASVIDYNHSLLMFGGIDKDMHFLGDTILVSEDEGFTWHNVDTLKNRLPMTYGSRQKQTVVVDKDNFIYVIGGQTQTECHSDIYRGRLNSIDWNK